VILTCDSSKFGTFRLDVLENDTQTVNSLVQFFINAMTYNIRLNGILPPLRRTPMPHSPA
jgi:hypothetical protein